jgi:hypothetical protein
MYKQHLLFNLEREIILLKQFGRIIEEKDLAFRPSEKVRSTLELMQYLSSIGSLMMRWLIKDDLTKEDFIKIKEHRLTLTLENFEERLDQQLDEIKMYMGMITEDDLLKEVELPNKEKMPLGTAIINSPIKWMAAYRMQIFISLKISGKQDLSTREAWPVMN